MRTEGLWSAFECETPLVHWTVGLEAFYYGVTAGGNFQGRNILHVPLFDEGEWSALDGARKQLYAARAGRVAPAAGF